MATKITWGEIVKMSTFVGSEECIAYEDRLAFDANIEEAKEKGGQFKEIVDNYDNFIYENNTHYLLNDCGLRELRKKITEEDINRASLTQQALASIPDFGKKDVMEVDQELKDAAEKHSYDMVSRNIEDIGLLQAAQDDFEAGANWKRKGGRDVMFQPTTTPPLQPSEKGHKKVDNGWVFDEEVSVDSGNSDSSSIVAQIQKIIERDVPGVAAIQIYEIFLVKKENGKKEETKATNSNLP